MTKSAIYVSYARSLLWIALFAALIAGVTNIVVLVLVDFVHGNPHRTHENAISMMVLFTPLFGFIAGLLSLVVFAPSQVFQAILTGVVVKIPVSRIHFAVLLAMPLTAVLTWYCYDYLTPTDFNLGSNNGPDWTPYQHGITGSRYLTALAFQAPITLFNILYLDADLRCRSKKPVLIAAFALAIAFGGVCGSRMAITQFQFL